MDTSLFVHRLQQVIYWLMPRLRQENDVTSNPITFFRQFNPVLNGQLLYSFVQGDVTWNVDPYDVSHFTHALDLALAQRPPVLDEPPYPMAELSTLGRILCFSTRMTTHDGIAPELSQGFMDDSDAPPLDTWFYLQEAFLHKLDEPTLFCWIPKPFEPLVQAAMQIQVRPTYEWLDKAAPHLYAQCLVELQ